MLKKIWALGPGPWLKMFALHFVFTFEMARKASKGFLKGVASSSSSMSPWGVVRDPFESDLSPKWDPIWTSILVKTSMKKKIEFVMAAD